MLQDKSRGALKTLANEEKYETFVIPDNVGGRFSVLTAVGLLPIATSGIDIDKLMKGAQNAQGKYLEPNIKYNDCYKYAHLISAISLQSTLVQYPDKTSSESGTKSKDHSK